MIETIRSNAELSSVLTYHLIAQTPLIHFQHDQVGATLRATEVKPKLDEFLKKKFTEEKDKSWYVRDTSALNYKLRLIETNRRDTIEIGRGTNYDIYYGNQGQEKNIKKGVLSDVQMTVLCSNPDLRAMIDRFVGEFFTVTNFGSMNGKGFGSFVVQERQLREAQIADALKRNSAAQRCYAFSGGDAPFRRIKNVYSAMKSGLSFGGNVPSALFLYMRKTKGIENEKEWLRVNRLVPLRPQESGHCTKYRYVRALLGVGDKAEYRLQNRKNVVISMKSAEIQRLASPIFFKVIGNKVYLVANRINEKIYGQKFEFSNGAGRSKELEVPSKDMLGVNFIDDFLEYAVKEINQNKSKALRDVEIREVR